MKPPPEISRRGISRVEHNAGDSMLDVGTDLGRIFRQELTQFLQRRGARDGQTATDDPLHPHAAPDTPRANARGVAGVRTERADDAAQGSAIAAFIEGLESAGQSNAARGGAAK